VLSIFAAAVMVATTLAVGFAWRALDTMSDELRTARLREAELLAAQVEYFVSAAFFDLELTAAVVATDMDAQRAPAFGTGSLPFDDSTVATLLFDGEGELAAMRPSSFVLSDAEVGRGELAAVVAAATNAVSEPFTLAEGGHVVVALGVPMYASAGDRIGTVVGLIDLTGPVMAGFVEPAERIGVTGHADLIDDRGKVLVSTNPGHTLGEGDHPVFYTEAAELRAPLVRTVPHHADSGDVDVSAQHVMAWVPLRNAPWAVALGASEQETLAPVARLRTILVAAGLASLVVLAAGAVIAVGVQPKPTGAPEADGDDSHNLPP
jgi:hypothetical protein